MEDPPRAPRTFRSGTAPGIVAECSEISRRRRAPPSPSASRRLQREEGPEPGGPAGAQRGRTRWRTRHRGEVESAAQIIQQLGQVSAGGPGGDGLCGMESGRFM